MLGGWTAIQKISFTESNLRLEDESYNLKDLLEYSDHRQTVSSSDLLRLQKEMGFKQFRFYCHKKKVGTVFHIMTNINPLGESVVEYFIDDNLISSRPQACGSYTVLADDNSTMSEDCSKFGWNGTHADGKWSRANIKGKSRILQAIQRRQDFHRFYAFPKKCDCDDWDGGQASLSPGDTWAVFVR